VAKERSGNPDAKAKKGKKKRNNPLSAYQAARLARDIDAVVTSVKTRDPAPVMRRLANKAIGRTVVSNMYVKKGKIDWLQIGYSVVGFFLFQSRKKR